jgi:hypothetical protein
MRAFLFVLVCALTATLIYLSAIVVLSVTDSVWIGAAAVLGVYPLSGCAGWYAGRTLNREGDPSRRALTNYGFVGFVASVIGMWVFSPGLVTLAVATALIGAGLGTPHDRKTQLARLS